MNSFWLKVVVLLILIVGAIILINRHSSPPQPPRQTRNAKQHPATEDIRPKPEPKTKQVKPVEVASEPQKQQPLLEQMEQINPHAENLYQMALVESKIAKKPMMTYKRMVDYCRQIIELYPQSPQAPKARELLREMPQRYKKQYKITNEEMGLSE